MAARLCVSRFCAALQPLAMQSKVLGRCLSVSAVTLIKRPTFDGPALPKKPLNPYALFVMDNVNSARMAESNRLDVKKLGEMWKELDKSEKDRYKTRYDEEKRAYKERVDQFMSELGGEEKQEQYLKSLAEYRAKRRAYLKQFRLKKLGLIKPRKVSGYQVFAGERLREAGGHSLNVPLIKEIPSLWKALSDEEREGYQKAGEELYATRLAEYNERLEKAQKEGIVPNVPVEKKDEKTKKSKSSTAAKKKTGSAKKKASSVKKKSSKTTKSATSSKQKKTTAAKKESEEKSTKPEDDEEWITSDDED